MFKRKKLTTLVALTLMSSSLLIGCQSSSDGSGAGLTATSKDVLANQNARAAIAKMIDKEGYADVVLNDGSEATDQFTPSGLSFNNGVDYAELTSDMGHAYNEEEAKELWEKAKEELGFDNVSINILTSDTDNAKKTGEYIQSELSDLDGLDVTITNLPFAQRLERESSGDFDMSYSGWGADYPDPLSFLTTMETGNKYSIQVGYSSEEFDSLVEEAKFSTDATESHQKYAQAEQLMLEEGYIVPLFYSGVSYVEKEYVSGIINHTWGPSYTYKNADVDKDEKVLNLLDSADIPTMDVSLATDSVSFGVMNNTMEGLTRTDENGNVIMAGAESYETSEDGLTWTFKLNQNSKWSNGESVTANDYKYSWDRTLNPETASQYAYKFDSIESYEVLDDYTFEVTLKRPVTYFAELMSFPIMFPQNQAFVESVGASYGTSVETQLYNGPFTLTTWRMEDQYGYTKNENYWDKDSVNLDSINFKIVKDRGTAINLYKSGEIDRVALSSEYVDEFRDSSEIKSYLEAATYILQINGGK
ncbi:MAG: ABC transporter substrate-binding protein [Peptostreptococcaceae bacterium]